MFFIAGHLAQPQIFQLILCIIPPLSVHLLFILIFQHNTFSF